MRKPGNSSPTKNFEPKNEAENGSKNYSIPKIKKLVVMTWRSWMMETSNPSKQQIITWILKQNFVHFDLWMAAASKKIIWDGNQKCGQACLAAAEKFWIKK